MASDLSEFNPAKAVTLSDWHLKNHDREYNDDALVAWAEKNEDTVSDFFDFQVEPDTAATEVSSQPEG